MTQAGMEHGSSGDSSEFDPTRSMELAWLGQRGDAGAVNELLTRYIPRMRRIVNIKIGRWQRARVDPEDVLQETLIVANRRLPELEVRSPSSILQWMARIADFEIKNCLEYTGAEKRDPAREQRMRSDEDSVDGSDSGPVVVSSEPTASQILSVRELEQHYDDCLAALEPPHYREVILMRDLYECDWEAIRVKLGRSSLEAVHSLYKHARERLQEALARYQD